MLDDIKKLNDFLTKLSKDKGCEDLWESVFFLVHKLDWLKRQLESYNIEVIDQLNLFTQEYQKSLLAGMEDYEKSHPFSKVVLIQRNTVAGKWVYNYDTIICDIKRLIEFQVKLILKIYEINEKEFSTKHGFSLQNFLNNFSNCDCPIFKKLSPIIIENSNWLKEFNVTRRRINHLFIDSTLVFKLTKTAVGDRTYSDDTGLFLSTTRKVFLWVENSFNFVLKLNQIIIEDNKKN